MVLLIKTLVTEKLQPAEPVWWEDWGWYSRLMGKVALVALDDSEVTAQVCPAPVDGSAC